MLSTVIQIYFNYIYFVQRKLITIQVIINLFNILIHTCHNNITHLFINNLKISTYNLNKPSHLLTVCLKKLKVLIFSVLTCLPHADYTHKGIPQFFIEMRNEDDLLCDAINMINCAVLGSHVIKFVFRILINRIDDIHRTDVMKDGMIENLYKHLFTSRS